MLRLTGDPSVGTGDTSANNFTSFRGFMGNDTGVESLYADSNIYRFVLFTHPSFSGALYDWDFSGVPAPGFYTYGNRVDYGSGQVIVRGTTSSGTAATSIANSFTFWGDPNVIPIEEPGSQLDWKSALMENRELLISRALFGPSLIGGGLFNNRTILDGSDSGIGTTDISFYGGTARSLFYNLKFDPSLGFVYLGSGPAFAWRDDGSALMELYGAATSGTLGTVATITRIMAGTAGGGVQIGSPTGGDKGVGALNVKGTIWADGTQGIAACTVVTLGATITIKNGLITAFTGC